MLKAVLFDMDGVLIDSIEVWKKLFKFTLKHFGRKEISEEEFMNNVWARDMLTIGPKYFSGIELKKVLDFYFSHFLNFKEHLKVFPHSRDVLEKTKKLGLKIGIVTNTFHHLTEKLLKYTNLIDYCDIVIGADQARKGKPAPDGILLACKKLGAKPEEAFYVGDTQQDIDAGRAAGCSAIVGYKINADKRVDDLKDLLPIIEKAVK